MYVCVCACLFVSTDSENGGHIQICNCVERKVVDWVAA